MDGGHRGAAEPVDGLAGGADRQIRQQADHAGDVQALLGFRKGAADNDVFDIFGLDAGAR